MESYNITKNINKKITEIEGSNVVTVVNNTVESGLNIVSINTFVDNLKVYAFINSLESVKLPDFKLEDSESEKLYKTLDVEWKSPRKQLDVVISGDGTNWNLIGSVSLLNPSGYPYRMYNLLDFFTDGLGARLGNNFKVGVQVKDVGYGVLTDDDMLTIHGSYVQEYVIDPSSVIDIPPQTITASSEIQLTVDDVTVIVPSESKRKYLLIENFGNNQLRLLLGENLGFEIKIKPGGNYEFSTGGLHWTQAIYAIGDTLIRVSVGY
jgi:hypothetical protein